jgi:hypothetical protein
VQAVGAGSFTPRRLQDNTFGGLVSGEAAVYNATFAGNAPGTIAAGNRYVFSQQPTVTVTADTQSRVYDGTATCSARRLQHRQ